MNVPFVDARTRHRAFQQALDEALGRVMDRAGFAEFCVTQYNDLDVRVRRAAARSQR